MTDPNSLPLDELFDRLISRDRLNKFLESALNDDGQGSDLTTTSIIPVAARARAAVRTRAAGVMAGLPILRRLWDGWGDWELLLGTNDGNRVSAGQKLAIITYDLRAILSLERPILNILCWLSGIATLTRQYVDAVQGTDAKICSTRKTTPGLRRFEKYAVRCGGGTLHRIGLQDAALFKDNHLAGIELNELASKLAAAAQSIRAQHDVRFIEVEVDTIAQLQEVLRIERGLIDMVLLDNMSRDQLLQAVEIRNAQKPGVLLEASGGVNLSTVQGIAETGVDRISVGAITHSAPWLDIGLDIAR